MSGNFFSDIYNRGLGLVNHCYPFARDQVVKHGKPVWSFLQGRAYEYPVTALITSNVLLFLGAVKVSSVTSKIIETLSFGCLKRNLTSSPIAISFIAAVNYGLYQALQLNVSLEVSIAVPILTFCFCVLCHKVLHFRR